MRKIVFVFALMLSLFLVVSCATTNVTEIDDYVRVIEVNGASADDLFVKANSWMVDAFNNSESVIEYSDKQAGMIKGKFMTKEGDYFNGYRKITAIITIETKEGKARLSVVYNGNQKVSLNNIWVEASGLPESVYAQYLATVEALGISLEHALNSKSAEW